jgi:hypothetical protein
VYLRNCGDVLLLDILASRLKQINSEEELNEEDIRDIIYCIKDVRKEIQRRKIKYVYLAYSAE